MSTPTSTTTTPAPQSTGPSFFTLLLGGLAVMLLGNLLGRYISTRLHRTIGRKLYYVITIPVMVLFIFIVFVLGEKMTATLQYVVFAAYILLFSVLGGFVEVPAMPARMSTPRNEQGPSEPPSDTTIGSNTVDGEGRDIEQDSPINDKTQE